VGQKEFLQEILAKMQLKKRWDKESFSARHKGHSRSFGGIKKTELSLDFVGTMSQAIFHKKRVNLALRFQRSFQEAGRKEKWGGGGGGGKGRELLDMEKAEETEKEPLLEGVHKRGEELGEGGTLSLRISLMLEGVKREQRRGTFQEQEGEIRSRTKRVA
jgi:hypothetical protein